MKTRMTLIAMLLMFTAVAWAQDNDTEVPDIDLSTGAHFTVNLSQPGTLKQRLTAAVFETDYDLVDFLTIKGKLSGADLAYLNAQEGLVSQLQYLDLTDVELVYDDQPYHSFSRGTQLEGGIKVYTFYLSAENREEGGAGGINDMNTSRFSMYRNNLAAAFRGLNNLKQCKLPKTLQGLGEMAFANCKSIEKVTLPDGLTYIGDEAFLGASGFGPENNTLKSVVLPSTVDSIGASAFIYQPLSNIDISHVSRFGDYCFQQTYIKTAQLSDKVRCIPQGMFYNCSELSSINIPRSVETIGSESFSLCGHLTSVTMDEGVMKIGQKAFRDCGQLNNIVFASTIEEIGSNAFEGVPCVNNIAAEEGVRYIGKVAYKCIDGTTSISIKEGTVSIADGFTGGWKYTGSHEWWGQSDLASITLPSTLRILGAGCFVGTKITSITLPDHLEIIGNGAFYDCDKLRRVTIPAKVTSLGALAFGGRCGVVRVNYNAINAESWSEYHEASSQGDAYTEYAPVFGSALTRVIIAEGVKTIPTYTFRECKNITRVQMPSTVETIGLSAFEQCSSLTHIDLPTSLKSMGQSAFADCDGLASVTSYMKEPSSLWTIDEEKIKEGWTGGVMSSTYYSNGPFGSFPIDYVVDQQGEIHLNSWYEFRNGNIVIIPVDTQAKYGSQQIALLQVPNGSLEAYQNETSWASTFKTITNFDGASDTETIAESTTVSVSQSVTDDTDLSGTIVDGIYVTLDTEDSGDGYDATDGCIVINSQTTEEGVAAACADGADDLTVKNLLNGLVFEIPAGKGKITLDCQTLGSRVLYVKIGNGESQKVTLGTRGSMTFNYDVTENTRVFVYAANDNVQASRNNSERRAAYANDNSVKLYGLSITVDEIVNGINNTTVNNAQHKDGKYIERNRIIIRKGGVRYNTTGQRVK